MSMCVCVNVYVCVYVSVSICMHVYGYMCACVCVYIWVCMCLYVCVCERHWDLGVTFSSSRTEYLLMDTKEKEDLKRRQNLSHEAGTFLISSSFCVFIPSCSFWVHLSSSIRLGCFSVTISDLQTTRSNYCLRAPAPAASPVPSISLCADSQAQFPKFVS